MTGVEAAVVSAIVSGILKNVGNKLAPQLIKKYSSIVGFKKDLQELQVIVEEINSRLERAGDHAMGGDASFNWLKQLEDAAYAVDDVVDEFQLKAERHDAFGDGGIVSKYRFQFKMANKIKAIKKRLDAIVKQRTDLNAIANNFPVCHSAQQISNTNEHRTTLPNVDVASVLRREKEKHQIISKLIEINDQERIKIVSIFGLGGSGKTTLAKPVFNDCDIIEKHYEVRLWVHVSQEFNVEKLIKKLFEAFADNNPGQHAVPYMSKTISEKLTEKRFLLVLDDVWTESQILWEQFMVHLKVGAHGSRILLTTRSGKFTEVEGSAYQFDLPFYLQMTAGNYSNEA